MTALFTPVDACWVCGGTTLDRVHAAHFALDAFAGQDPELATYSGATLDIRRCRDCGFAQPAGLPALPRFFDRMYDQRWSAEWVENEHRAEYKDAIFADILRALSRRLPPERRRLLDVGAHAGRFLAHASRAGWAADGLEVNPRTAAYAASATGATVHRGNLHSFDSSERYDAVTLTDVLEHIPEPRTVLRRVARLLTPGGWVAIKVPHAPAQRFKEGWRQRLRPGYRADIANNLVHVNHFSARSLATVLRAEGFTAVTVTSATPEYPATGVADRLVRQGLFLASRWLPGGVRTPLAMNLQAYARR